MRIIKGILLLLAMPALALAVSPHELRGIGVTVADGGARIELDTSAQTSAKFFTLNHPERVVVDLKNTRLASGVRVPEGSGVVATIRTGNRPGGTLRVVIELKSDLAARGKWMASPVGVGKQFVIEVGKGAPSVFATVAANEASAVETATVETAPAKVVPKAVLPAHAPIDNDRDIIIAVDAGHGGVDPGAIGRNGTQEKDVTLAIARALAERINDEPGMRATLIRDSDTFVVLRDRMARARAAKADMFVSIHADSIRDRSITGASVYVLSERGASSEAARWLAERENAADLAGGVSLDDKSESLASVLLNLSQTASISASMTAAERVLAELDQTFGVRKSRVQQAGLVVLKSPDIPSMLIETGYISNPGEEARLKSRRGQQRLADSIFTGLRGYFEVNPPAGTRLARMRRSTLAGVASAPASP
ncbi:MAG TPA: N-acetylmuramoyl-L-alanine amidase [Steroidobacteraceae bacterium]|nr:N-acetylmuramoyl-L-alanine amidase [Steroidobacteraceae bacterium]